MNEEIRGTGAEHSEVDPRTIKHDNLAQAGAPLITGGIDYSPEDIEDQHKVGICTAISRVQLRQKQTGKKYSPDFQYLCQKKFYDKNWNEGSSVLTANKVAKNIGFLPIELFTYISEVGLFTYISEVDRLLSYNAYITKLQAIPDSEIERLKSLCVDKIVGYAQVNVSDPQAIAKAIIESPNQTGILCRYGCQKNWWTSIAGVVSWFAKDIDPLRNGPETSGHAIINSWFDYTTNYLQKLVNTWGINWCLKGSAHINWSNYPMTEAWVDLLEAPVINQYPTIRRGSRGIVVEDLQTKLNIKRGCNLLVDGRFGEKTLMQVVAFQTDNKLSPDGIVGPKTWAVLNK